MIPVLNARDVRHAVVASIPSLDAVDAEQPKPRPHVGKHDETIVIAHVDTECALLYARGALPAVVRIAAEPVFVLALTGEPVTDRLRILRIREVEDLQSILIRGDEDVWPAHFMIVRQVAPVRRPRADRNVDVLGLAGLAGLEIPDSQ